MSAPRIDSARVLHLCPVPAGWKTRKGIVVALALCEFTLTEEGGRHTTTGTEIVPVVFEDTRYQGDAREPALDFDLIGDQDEEVYYALRAFGDYGYPGAVWWEGE
jgi:hypothetical protein